MVVREAGNVAKREVTPVQSKPTSSSGLGRMTLQERLAASIAKSRTGSPKTPGEEGSTVVTPARSSGDTSRIESNGTIKENIPSSPIRIETPKLPVSPIQSQTPITELKDIPSRTETPDIQVIPGEYTTTEPEVYAQPDTAKADPATIAPPSETRISTEPSPTRTSSISLSTSIPPDTDPATIDLVSQLRNDLATCEARRVEESQQASERISSLEEKLKTLLETTVNASRELASNPNAESWESKLAEREEKIALLLDEGLSERWHVANKRRKTSQD
jgi:TATA element modulatory factor